MSYPGRFNSISHDAYAALTTADMKFPSITLSTGERVKEYYGDVIDEEEVSRVTWARIPHFYSTPYYVYPDLTVVLMSDGAPEMRNLLRSALDDTTLGTTVYELLDFWHLLEKLAAAAHVLHGDADVKEVLARWRVDLLNRNAAADDILTALKRSGRPYVRVGQNQPVHEAITYIENHRELLGYPGARR